MTTPTDQLKKSLWIWVRKYDLPVSQEQLDELADFLFVFVDQMIERHTDNYDHDYVDRDY